MPRTPFAALPLALLCLTPAAFGETLHRSGPAQDRLDLVILADGFRSGERAAFDAEARDVLRELRETEPFASRMNRMNVHTGFRPSARSGASQSTAYGTHFTGGFFDTKVRPERRLLILEDAARAGGEADAILVIVNVNRRGGTAYGPLCFATTGAGPRAALHELGHAIGGLGDEYSSGSPVLSQAIMARLYPNLTLATTREQLPWKQWVKPSTKVPAGLFTSGVSAYRGGAGYSSGIYRPTRRCRMRTDTPGFCVVCRNELDLRIRDASSPGSSGGGVVGGGTPGRVVGVTTRLRVRAGASTATAILGHLAPGAAVRVLGPAQGGFYPIAFNGRTGYVGRNFVRLGGANAGLVTLLGSVGR